MLWVLVKKQINEVFKSYFFDAKKNKMRSKGAIAAWIIFFVIIMVGVLGGMFTVLSFTLCTPMSAAGMGWLFYLIMSGLAIIFGAFGSVFNTFTSLYLAKDNELLLSMPIPVKTLITARLINVYLMGTMYSATVLIPALIVGWIVNGVTAANVICGIMLYFIVTGIVLLLSCLLGWVVAKISVKLKNRSFITVIISLLFIAGYYFFYFKANDIIQDIIRKADVYGNKIKGSAYVLYLFGRIGEGEWIACAVFLAIVIVCAALIWIVISRSFIKIATASGKVTKKKYTEKTVRAKSAFGALFGKELARFTSSPNYMLNCGLSILLIPATGVFFLVKGGDFCKAVNSLLPSRPDLAAIALCAMASLLVTMNNMAAPSVSLEGKNIWIAQSLPVNARLILRAKAALQFVLTAVPVLFTGICFMIILDSPITVRVLVLLFSLIFTLFMSLFDTMLSIKFPFLDWTNENSPMKQSACVMLSMFGGWILSMVAPAAYILEGYKLGSEVYMCIACALFAAMSLLLFRWIETRGAKIFASL